MIAIKREDCPDHVPLPEGVKGQKGYGDMEGVEVGRSLSSTSRELEGADISTPLRFGIKNTGHGWIEDAQ